MTKEESIKIKEELLRKQVSVNIGNVLVTDDVILIDDALNIINEHVGSDSGRDYDEKQKKKKKGN